MNANAERPPLLLSRLDVERIEELLELPEFRGLNTDALRGELERAEVTEPAAVPAQVMTMNSIALVRVDDARFWRRLAARCSGCASAMRSTGRCRGAAVRACSCSKSATSRKRRANCIAEAFAGISRQAGADRT